ncbi:exonuclease domain-containing protein [Sphingobacterium faecale]|uniref:3'-5' exoribonuclease n=1 Tax=Sphingobacterium faecale TaxID=2803775 RepID=A0ABS1R8C4_9SPHI|nr:exonuclease domain-containing protein [Sphingobacterium faecale]MBL1410484.1 3'-5' exoribonuclease [Sphingobacterium faecale]
MDTFTTIDFELATSDYTSVCAVGVVNVVGGEISNEFYSLVRPPQNKYMWQTTRVHGIKPKDTAGAPTFRDLYPMLEPLLLGQFMVAHNESFDRAVLQRTMKLYGLDYTLLKLPETWACTSNIYREKGFVKTKLSICCDLMRIPLEHHDALSDARASALLYLKKDYIPAELLR